MSRKETADECPIVPELARHFRAKNKSGIVTCLAQLKSDPKRRKEFAQRISGLHILVQLLRYKSDAIVNMSLSILADACMAYDVREKVKDSKIGINIVLIIKNLKLDTKLHCRACRLVSNLSESSWHVKVLCNAGVVKALIPLLILKTSTQTYCMAIRAMRNIWSFYVHIRETMVELQIIKLITQLFVMAEEKSYEDAKHAELVDACLKAMCAFLVTLDPRCGEQMEVDKDKQGYKCLMRCCNKGNNKMAIKCLYILCQIAECRLQLGISGTIEEVIAWINSVENSSTELLYEEVLISLCLFCRESVNRNRIKNSDGLQLIIVLLNNSKHERYHSMLLHALVQFVYDDNALDILTKHGIMDVLVAKLKDVIAVDMDLTKLKDDKNNAKKRFSDNPSEYLSKRPLKCSRTYANRTRFSMDFYRDDWSPRSVTSASSSSPPSTPPLPLCSDSNAETDDTEDDDIYSPICSDTECGDNDEDEEVASLKSYKSLTTAETNFDSPTTSSETSGKINACEFYTIQLLNKLSFFRKPIDELADPKIIKPLTTYIKYTRKQNIQKYRYIAIKILKRIMNNTAYFLPLLKQGLVFDLQTLPEAEDCTRRLRMVAETGGAIGQLSFILLRGEDEYKLLTAVSIPLLIKTHRSLKCLLDKYGGLQLIFSLLRESSHKLHERAIWSICQLARTLKIYSPDQSITVAKASMKATDYSRLSLDETTSHTKPTVSSTVTFELDDGTTVEACKRMLCRRSDFFSVMLEGNFSESGKRRVRLKNTSRDGLNTLILAASGALFERENIESLLDATLLADKFLMSDLSDALTESSVAKLNHETFCRAWCWGRNYSCHEWRSYCVKSFLTAKLSWSETMQTFRDFYATDAFDEFLHEVRDIIEDMQRQNNLWIAGFLIVVLTQACLLEVVNTEDVTTKKKITPSHAEGQEKKQPSDLEGSETSYFGTFAAHKNLYRSYNPTVYFSTNPLSFIPPSSNFPTSTSSFPFIPTTESTSDNIHRQIKCGDTFFRSCQPSRYRSYDGSCNNLQNPTWGLANTRYGRLVRARYGDGIRTPPTSVTGGELPLARAISYTMFPNAKVDDVIWTLVAMQYGQIMTHDMGLIDGTTQSKSHRTRCCTFNGQLSPSWTSLPRCFPIIIPNDDPVYDSRVTQCMNFVRSTTDLDRSCSSSYKPAEQLNTVTHYLDLSLVYGPSDEVAASLRAGFGGRLNVEVKNNRAFPPPAANRSATCDTIYEFESCYATGDTRVNQNPQLTILQIVLLREHNRIADYLAQLNPHWTDETIFQETRRIVIAQHQNIAYYEWLPIFLGTAQVFENKIVYHTKNYVNDYDETVIANVLNEHANAANRYFHTNIVGSLNLVTEGRQYSPSASLRLSDHFNRPGIIERGNNLDDLTRGLASQPQSNTDVFLDKEITQFFFRRGRALGSDLRAIDIQRDRDHGLASYNDYREYCGLQRAKTFDDFGDLIPLSDIQKLSLLYASPDDVDLSVGGALERHVSGALVGPTFQCIITRQFQQTRIGDRYWFETGDPSIAFTLGQLNELRKSSISRLLCDNGDNIQNMQRFGFARVSDSNPLERCDDLPQVDLSLWKDYSSDYQAYQRITPLYK